MRMTPWSSAWLVIPLLAVLLQAGCKQQESPPVNPPSTNAAVPTKWTETAPGIEVRRMSWNSDARTEIIVVRADPARCRIRVIDKHQNRDGQGATAAQACPTMGAAINASYFAEDLTPLGLLIVDGKRVRPMHTTGTWGLFYVKNGLPHLALAQKEAPSGITQAVQCKPRLVVNGKAQSFKQQPTARRSAVALDGRGRLLFAAADGYLTLEEWAAFLKDDLGCVEALNLDGGPSTQLAVRGKITADVYGGWDVPVFLIAEPRK